MLCRQREIEVSAAGSTPRFPARDARRAFNVTARRIAGTFLGRPRPPIVELQSSWRRSLYAFSTAPIAGGCSKIWPRRSRSAARKATRCSSTTSGSAASTSRSRKIRTSSCITDLESTNGTKVNGEDIQLRILRYGDMISLGRSVLLFGSREQIAERLAELRGEGRTLGHDRQRRSVSARRRPARSTSSSTGAPTPTCKARCTRCCRPSCPSGSSPGQAAQLCELLEYLHIRVRDLFNSVKIKADAEQVTLETRQWQNLIDLQARLASYLRAIGQPPEED